MMTKTNDNENSRKIASFSSRCRTTPNRGESILANLKTYCEVHFRGTLGTRLLTTVRFILLFIILESNQQTEKSKKMYNIVTTTKQGVRFFHYQIGLLGNIVLQIRSEKLELNQVIVIKNSCVRALFYRHHIFWRSQFYVALQITFLEDQSFMIFFEQLSMDIIKCCTS